MLNLNFQFFKKFIYDKTGIVIDEKKIYLVESRFRKIRIKYAINKDDQIIEQIRNNNKQIIGDVIDVMTTNETSFFRDQRYFDTIKNEIIPKFIENRKNNKRLKIWSVACSYGQEAYSIAFIINELMQTQLKGWDVKIIATDICTNAIEKAKKAQYSQFEVQRGLPIEFLIKYFSKKDETWQIKPEISNMVEFMVHNLKNSFSQFGLCDIIICRNVLIYFDDKTKTDITNRLSKNLVLDGILILGTVDTVAGKVSTLKEVIGKPGLYQKSQNSGQQILMKTEKNNNFTKTSQQWIS